MTAKASFNRPWRYALAMFGLSITGYMYQTYGTFFYNDKLGLSMVAISIGNVFFAIWDAFNDPLAGHLSDRTRTRWGRRRPWLLSSIILFGLASVLFFSPPGSLGNGAALAVYFTVFLMLTETANTIASVNYHSLLPELFREVDKRNSANSIRQALQLVGMIISVSLAPTLAGILGYPITALIIGVLGCGIMLFSILGCKERQEFSESPQPKLWASLKAIATNRNFWPVAVSHFFYSATSGLLLAGIPFYIKYGLGLADGMATFLTASVFVPAVPCMFLWYKLINRFGAIRVWRIALLVLFLALIPFYFAGDLIMACVFGVFVGAGIAGITANLDMVNSELIEDDAARYGLRREATIFAGVSFITRLSSLVRSGVFMLLFIIFGFESSDNPGADPASAAKFMMIVFPAVLMACSVGVSFLVKFKKERD
ncbi:MAG: MFS transporter [Treponema sp.]|jgi:GPH family glycoside/pentoside/hexuronide:cation symporter|nr:MFS transporter [Treponema sp.]